MIFGRTMNGGNGVTSSTSNNLHDPMTPTNKYVRERWGERTREKENAEREKKREKESEREVET